MDVSKQLRVAAARIGILAGVLVALTIFINLSWFDETLHPDLARLAPPRPVSMEGNAYALIYGFPAASDRDPRRAGLAIIEILRQRFESGEDITLSEQEIGDILGNPETQDVWNGIFPAIDCNARFAIDCADRLIADAALADANHPRLRLLLDRYETILSTPRFEENQEYDVSTPVPFNGELMAIARIRLALEFRTGSNEEILADIAEDVAFWKRMLRDGQSLIAKMVALAGLRNDTTFLSTLLRERDLSADEIGAVDRILSPLTADERDIGETFLAELRISLLSEKPYALMLDGPPALARLALQENATLNEYFFTTTIPLQLKASLSASEFYDQGAYEPLAYDVRAVPPPLYNLGGKFILKWMASRIGHADYISRVHDLDGRIALVLLQAEIAQNPNRRPQAVVQSSRYRNPYTLEPFDYDPDAGTIGFDCLANGTDVCAVAIGRRR
ncbi:MAG TPA: hypothetical protein VMR74_12045 [Gammaproteobacteria bacterium]|nr:hypothetical protein [Gammaproteobacteria bacterium]